MQTGLFMQISQLLLQTNKQDGADPVEHQVQYQFPVSRLQIDSVISIHVSRYKTENFLNVIAFNQ